MITTQQALGKLDQLEESGIQLLGLDGFLLHPDGRYESPLSLIIDFTTGDAPVVPSRQRFEEARRFINSHDGTDIRWEIVAGTVDE